MEELFIIKNFDAWTPQIRSKTAIRSGKKHIFENLVLRDLPVYASAHNARILHYTDDTGLEADAVYQMEDGRYALIEIITGINKVPDAEKTLINLKK